VLSWLCDRGLKNFRYIIPDKLFPFLEESENSREAKNGNKIKQNEKKEMIKKASMVPKPTIYFGSSTSSSLKESRQLFQS
jgi:hypothetical protein